MGKEDCPNDEWHHPMISLKNLGYTTETALETFEDTYLMRASKGYKIEKICTCENKCYMCIKEEWEKDLSMCKECGGDSGVLLALQPRECTPDSAYNPKHSREEISLEILGLTHEDIANEFSEEYLKASLDIRPGAFGRTCCCTQCSSCLYFIICKYGGSVLCERCGGDKRLLAYISLPVCENCEGRSLHRSPNIYMERTDTGWICDPEKEKGDLCKKRANELFERLANIKPAKR